MSTRNGGAAVLVVAAGLMVMGSAQALMAPSGAGVSALETGAPRGLHLSITGDAQTSMTVTWFTNGSDDPDPVVEWGHSESELVHRVAATSGPVTGVDVRVHAATITGLEPGQRVYYRAMGDSGSSPVWSFVTDDGDGVFTFALIGDHDINARAQAATDAVVAHDPDLFIVAGDLAYADSNTLKWDTWFDMIEPLSATRPLMTAIGNHENEDDFGTDPYRSRMTYSGDERWHSFEYGRVHWLIFDADLDALRAEGGLEEQFFFAEEDLAAAYERKQAGLIDFIFLVQHHPVYGNQDSTSRQIQPHLVAQQEQWALRYDVDVIWSGHNHHYERSKPMFLQVPTTDELRHYEDPLGWILIISGGGGRSLYNFVDPNDFKDWSAAWARRYHYTINAVEDGTLSSQAIDHWDIPGDVLDEWSLRVTPAGEEPLLRGLVPGLPFPSG